MTHDNSDSIIYEAAPQPGCAAAFCGALGHALVSLVRRKRIYIALGLTILPIGILVVAWSLLPSRVIAGDRIFRAFMDNVYVMGLPQLLALLLATMLIAEHIEGRTLSYVLTRPMSRPVWVWGRFTAYAIVSIVLLVSSMLAFSAICLMLPGLDLAVGILTGLPQYIAAACMAVIVYGALLVLLGVLSRRPVVLGVFIMYGWETLAIALPGAMGLLTVTRYVRRLTPEGSMLQNPPMIATRIGDFELATVEVSLVQALVTLVLLSLLCVFAAGLALKYREFSGARATGT